MSGRVAIIIVNWNGANDTLRSAASVEASTYKDVITVVVDNNSHIDDYELLREHLPTKVACLRLEQNTGFTGGNNIGIQHALSLGQNIQYILLLNNDAVLEETALEKMISTISENPKTGAVGPKIKLLGSEGLLQTTGDVLHKKTGKIQSPVFGTKDDFTTPSKPHLAEYITGAAFLIRTEVLKKIGLLDNTFFAYWEDSDWCQRIREAGYDIAVNPSAVVWHKHSASTQHERTIPTYLSIRNRYIFFRKHRHLGPSFPILVLQDILQLWQIRSAGLILRGIFHGLFDRLQPIEYLP